MKNSTHLHEPTRTLSPARVARRLLVAGAVLAGTVSTTPAATSAQVPDPPPDDHVRIGVLGDYGFAKNPDTGDVADILRARDIDHIATVGDNSYGSASYQDNVGQFYCDWIPSCGSPEPRFWPAPGNHDYADPANNIQDYIDYFTWLNNRYPVQPPTPGSLYYQERLGPVHIFSLDSNFQEGDLIISAFQGDNGPNGKSEFIEIFNPTHDKLSLKKLSLTARVDVDGSGPGGIVATSVLRAADTLVEAATGNPPGSKFVIEPGSFLLIGEADIANADLIADLDIPTGEGGATERAISIELRVDGVHLDSIVYGRQVGSDSCTAPPGDVEYSPTCSGGVDTGVRPEVIESTADDAFREGLVQRPGEPWALYWEHDGPVNTRFDADPALGMYATPDGSGGFDEAGGIWVSHRDDSVTEWQTGGRNSDHLPIPPPTPGSRGRSEGAQAVWLQTALSQSDAPWKIVLSHHPARSSGLEHRSPGLLDVDGDESPDVEVPSRLDWDFAGMGADAVIAGHEHVYERLEHNEIPHFVNGLGGKSIRSFEPGQSMVDGSLYSYDDDFGAMVIDATETRIEFTFVDVTGVEQDSLVIEKPCQSPTSFDVAFVVGSTTLSAADARVKSHLASDGATVTEVDDDALAGLDLSDVELVVVSATVSPTKVGTRFRDVDTPVLVYESLLYDEMGFTNGPNRDSGQRSGLSIVQSEDPLAAGLATGWHKVTSTSSNFSYAENVGGDGVVVARNKSKQWIFKFDEGVLASGEDVAARRVGFFFGPTTASVANDAGWALFDAAVGWLSEGPDCTPPPRDDNDGVADAIDNCPATGAGVDFNPSQRDTDRDQQGDPCDPSPTAPTDARFRPSGDEIDSGNSPTWVLDVADVDNDGDIDAAVVDAEGQLTLWLNDGNGRFAPVGASVVADDLVFGDFDRDGDVDAFIVNDAGGEFHRNHGNGDFEPDDGPPPDGVIGFRPAHPDYPDHRAVGTAVDIGDFDGDGDLDVVITGAESNVWLNNGDGFFTPQGQHVTDDRIHGVGDLDTDGDLDLMTSRRIYWNDGDGIFDNDTALPEYAEHAALADLDGDGDLDAFTTEQYGDNMVFRNDGGTFSITFRSPSEYGEGVTLGDLDGDGDIDAVLSNGDEGVWPFYVYSNRIWLNDGDGDFTPRDGHMPATGLVSFVVDVDGDADLDALMTRRGSGIVQVWDNVSTDVREVIFVVGSAADVEQSTEGSHPDGVVKDRLIEDHGVRVRIVDDDDLVDLDLRSATAILISSTVEPDKVGATFRDVAVPVLIWEGHLYDDMGFTNGPNGDSGGRSGLSIVNPGHPLAAGLPRGWHKVTSSNSKFSYAGNLAPGGEIVAANSGKVWIFEFDRNAELVAGRKAAALRIGFFFGADTPMVSNDKGWALFDAAVNRIVESGPIALTDADGVDDDVDNCPATGAAVDFNIVQIDTDGDGIGDTCDTSPTAPSAGRFGRSGETLDPGWTYATISAIGDIDVDGDIDVMVQGDGLVELWLNNFTPGGQPNYTRTGSLQGDDAAFGDFNGDGLLDLFVVHATGAAVHLNDGNGGPPTGQDLSAAAGIHVVLGDFDGDDDLDAFISGSQSNVWLNDGNGFFTPTGQHVTDETANAVGDIDGDGDLDLVGNRNVYVNDGSARFVAGQRLATYAERVSLADLDGDGDLDAFVIGVAIDDTETNRVLRNERGVFFDTGQNPSGDEFSEDVVLADLDGDGDIDALVSNGEMDAYPGTPFDGRVWLNDGTGNFDATEGLFPASGPVPFLADVDGDGDLDAFLAGWDGVEIWTNGGAEVPTQEVVFVVGSTNLSAADAAVSDRLAAEGTTVTDVDDDALAGLDLTGVDLVVISSTVSPTKVDTTFRDVDVPVLVYESQLYDEMAFTNGPNQDSGNRSGLSIVAATHPLAAGLKNGWHKVTDSPSSFSYAGNVAGGAVVVATNNGKAWIFGFEDEAQLTGGGSAAERRVGLFFSANTAAVANGTGWALFDAAVDWLRE